MLDRVLDALGTLRSPFAPYEADLHLRVGECLSAAGLPAVHEALLAPGCRIDYLVGYTDDPTPYPRSRPRR